jgi:O-antigen ligase
MTSAAAGAAYPAQARIVALFLILAVVLGGGGSPNPTTELLLELAFAACAGAWLWLIPGPLHSQARASRLVLLLVAAALIVPVVQLLPLPSSIWTVLPSRQDQVAALSLVGKEHSWRPISLSPSRTLASLLAIVPAAGCAYAVARLDRQGRRLVIATIAAMAVVSTLLGVLQLMAGERGINLYPQFHAGWITGFQANRNAEADILLIGFLALVTSAAPYLSDAARKFPLLLDRRAALTLLFALALCLLAATIMTGSRAGIALMPVAVIFALAILGSARASKQEMRGARFALLAALVLLAGLAAVYLAYASHTAIARVAQRFTDDSDIRLNIWQDAWFALGQYWPVGFGMGGFEPAMIPSERLEVLGSGIPNRAHNDFLELGLEAGLLGYAMLFVAASTCFTMAYKSWRPENRANILFAAGALFVITLHSLVDYPLRSMALACLAGVAGGMLATASPRVGERETIDGRMESRPQ